ncbi:MAG: class I SAM-dependent methyltransferase [Nocardioidaceae bacterium]
MSDHYFSAEPSSNLRRAPVKATVWGHDLDLVSASGVFAHGRLDVGTSVLFRATEPPAGGTLLDLGCGYGAIGCALAVAAPDASVWAVDVNERALQLTAENAQRVGAADRIHISLPAAVPEDLHVDEIWSNPPIRIGKDALHELLLQWLPRLRPTGRAVLVVGKNLGADSLQSWLRAEGYGCERLASAKGFRVLEVRPH